MGRQVKTHQRASDDQTDSDVLRPKQKSAPTGGFGFATRQASEYTEQPQQKDDWDGDSDEPKKNAFHNVPPLPINISDIHLIRDGLRVF